MRTRMRMRRWTQSLQHTTTICSAVVRRLWSLDHIFQPICLTLLTSYSIECLVPKGHQAPSPSAAPTAGICHARHPRHTPHRRANDDHVHDGCDGVPLYTPSHPTTHYLLVAP